MDEGNARERWLERALVALLPTLVTLGRFKNGFVFDDVFVIERSDFIHTPSRALEVFTHHTMIASSMETAAGNASLDTFRPIPLLTFMWDAWLAGRDAWAYHLTNALLHAAVCVLLYELVRALLPKLSRAPRLGVVLMFALNPSLSEAYVWINGRSDPLMALGLLVAMLASLRDEWSTGRRSLVVGLGCLFALLSKEVAVLSLPFVVLLPWWRGRGEEAAASSRAALGGRQALAWLLPALLAFLVYTTLRWNALGGMRTHSGGGQIAAALGNLPLLLVDGLFHTTLPRDYTLRSLRDDYASVGAGERALAFGAVVLLVGAALRVARRAPLLPFGLLWFVATLAPVALISTALWPGFGRYLYVPMLGIVLALGGALQLVQRAPRFTRIAERMPLVLALLSGLLLAFATHGFANEERLYRAALHQSPEQAWTHGFLGLSYRREGDCARAIPLLRRAAEMDVGDPRYLIHLGHCFVETRQREAALQVALLGEARFPGTRQEAAFLLIHASSLPTFDPERARELLLLCLERNPARTDCAAGLEAIEGLTR